MRFDFQNHYLDFSSPSKVDSGFVVLSTQRPQYVFKGNIIVIKHYCQEFFQIKNILVGNTIVELDHNFINSSLKEWGYFHFEMKNSAMPGQDITIESKNISNIPSTLELRMLGLRVNQY